MPFMDSDVGRASLWRSGRFVFWGVLSLALLLLGLRGLTYGMADLLYTTNPALSLKFDSGHVGARLALARSLIERASDDEEPDRPRRDAAHLLRETLKISPLAPRALSLLATLNGADSDQSETRKLMQLAVRRDQRDLLAQGWMLNDDIRNRRFLAANARLDALLRGQSPSIWGPLLPIFTRTVTIDQMQQPFVALLARKPAWRTVILTQVAQQSQNLAAVGQLFDRLFLTAAPPTAEELRPYMARLVREGRPDIAHFVWLRTMTPEILGRLGLLYNAKFEYPVSNLPFDWILDPPPGSLATIAQEDGKKVLNVDFFGNRVDFRHVSHLLNLPPGTYIFSGLVQAIKLKNEVGLRWRIHCVGETDKTLMISHNFREDIPWREFSHRFEVPQEKCLFQNIVLELPIRVVLDTIISGGVSFSELALLRTPESFKTEAIGYPAMRLRN